MFSFSFYFLLFKVWPSKLNFITVVILCMCILSLRNWISLRKDHLQHVFICETVFAEWLQLSEFDVTSSDSV